MTSRIRRSALLCLLVVTCITTVTVEPVAAARKPRAIPPTVTSYTAPYWGQESKTGECASYINPNATCSERLYAERLNGIVTSDVDVHVGDNVWLNTYDYLAYADNDFIIPVTITQPRRSLHVDALLHAADVHASYDRPQSVWGWGSPKIETRATVLIEGTEAGAYTYPTQVTEPNTSQAVIDRDILLSFDWQPSGGIPAGEERIIVRLTNGVTAGTNGDFHSHTDFVVRYVNITEYS
jgi:hypothetical protein